MRWPSEAASKTGTASEGVTAIRTEVVAEEVTLEVTLEAMLEVMLVEVTPVEVMLVDESAEKSAENSVEELAVVELVLTTWHAWDMYPRVAFPGTHLACKMSWSRMYVCAKS